MPKLSRDRSRSYVVEVKPNDNVNATGDQAFYNSRRWRRKSTGFRKRFPLCEVGTALEETRAAEVVDHIIPISEGGARFDDRNLMSMSHHYHNKKRGYESKGFKFSIRHEQTESGLVPVDRSDVIALLTTGRGGVNL